MEDREIMAWLEEVDEMYMDIGRGPTKLWSLGNHLLRDYVWPLYDMAD